jgi:hypothetical protein
MVPQVRSGTQSGGAVWNDFKGHTANSLPLDKQDIRNSLHANTRRVRRSQDKLRSLILASELPSPFG